MVADRNPDVTGATQAPDSAPGERVAPPIESRFLFVDVAAQRAKQLRRGALPRLPELRTEPASAPPPDRLHKLERIAMEEVARGLIAWSIPDGAARREGTA